MFERTKKVWSWIKDKYHKFNDWCATWMPGFKTYLAAGLGAIGSGAAVLQEYITGLPLDKFMTGTQIAFATAILFSLAFWFRALANRE